MIIKKNIGTTDRLIRLGLGIVLLILAYWIGGGWMTWTLVVLGLMMLLSAAISWCPCKQVFGRSSYKGK